MQRVQTGRDEVVDVTVALAASAPSWMSPVRLGLPFEVEYGQSQWIGKILRLRNGGLVAKLVLNKICAAVKTPPSRKGHQHNLERSHR